MTVAEFISGSTFKYGVVPLLAAFIGILIKCFGRHDSYTLFKKEDFAVGPQLMLSAALTFAVLTTDQAKQLVDAIHKLSNLQDSEKSSQAEVVAIQNKVIFLSDRLVASAWYMCLLLVILFAFVLVIKRWGWKSENQLSPMIGIALPLVAGVAAIMVVMAAA